MGQRYGRGTCGCTNVGGRRRRHSAREKRPLAAILFNHCATRPFKLNFRRCYEHTKNHAGSETYSSIEKNVSTVEFFTVMFDIQFLFIAAHNFLPLKLIIIGLSDQVGSFTFSI
jgi:hypothetical protein